MNNQNNLHTKTIENLSRLVGRKKFFSNIGKGFIGLVLINSFPFKIFGKSISSSSALNRDSSEKKVEIKINPLAVSRDKDNKKNA
jgi:hypothetical protein